MYGTHQSLAAVPTILRKNDDLCHLIRNIKTLKVKNCEEKYSILITIAYFHRISLSRLHYVIVGRHKGHYFLNLLFLIPRIMQVVQLT